MVISDKRSFYHLWVHLIFMNSYQSLNVAVFDLRKKGYKLDFYHESGFITCLSKPITVSVAEVEVDEYYSFPSLHQHGIFNAVYAITTPSGVRGILFDCSRSMNYINSRLPEWNIAFSSRQTRWMNQIKLLKNHPLWQPGNYEERFSGDITSPPGQ